MVEIILTEWQSSTVTLSAPDVRYLVDLGESTGSPILTLTPQGGDAYLAHASHYVGLLRLPSGRTLEIRPKVPISNIFAMLNTVNDLGAFLPTLTSVDTFAGLLDILLEQFAVQLDHILMHGLLRGVTTQAEHTITIRGKLDISRMLREAPSIRHYSEASDTTTDILENRLLRLTCHDVLQRLPLSTVQTQRFHAFEQQLRGIAVQDISREAFRQLQFNRLNEHYRHALSLAELLLFSYCPTSAGTRSQYPSYLVNMHQLFERYTTIVLKRSSEGHFGVLTQPTYKLDSTGQLTIRPDVVIQSAHGSLVPVDAKYKVRLHHEDIYQVLAYCHALHATRAVLVYATDMPAQRFVIEYKGDVKIVIVVLGLNLAGDVTIMLNTMAQFADAVHRVVDEVPHHDDVGRSV